VARDPAGTFALPTNHIRPLFTIPRNHDLPDLWALPRVKPRELSMPIPPGVSKY